MRNGYVEFNPELAIQQWTEGEWKAIQDARKITNDAIAIARETGKPFSYGRWAMAYRAVVWDALRAAEKDPAWIPYARAQYAAQCFFWAASACCLLSSPGTVGREVTP